MTSTQDEKLRAQTHRSPDSYNHFLDGMQAAAEICGSLAETTYDADDEFVAATGCEAAIMQCVREGRAKQASSLPAPDTAGDVVAWLYHDEDGVPHLQFGRRPTAFVKRNGWTETPLYTAPQAPATGEVQAIIAWLRAHQRTNHT